MVLKLDVQTLAVCSMLASLAFAAVFLALALQRRGASYMLHWAASSGSYAATLMGFQYLAHQPLASVTPILNAMLAMSNLLLVTGVRSFHGLPVFRRWMIILPLVAMAGTLAPSLASVLGVSLHLGVIQASETSGIAIACGIAGIALLRAGPRPCFRGQRMAAGAVLAYLPAYCINISAQLAIGGVDRNGFAILPLLSDQLLLGIMYLGLLGMAAERGHRDLRAAAMQDPLTGVLNRAGLDECAHRFLHPGAAIVAMDVDKFKLINDGFGHAAGDAVLVALANAARAAIQGGGAVIRLGGDEFLALIASGGAEEAEAFLRRMRHGLTSSGSWSFSAGIAVIAQDDIRIASPIERADKDLYARKCAGVRRLAA